jgi:hypothetical protein
LHQNKSERPLLRPEEFVALLDADQETALRDLDFRVERYFDVALSEWIPEAFLKPESSHAEASRKALDGLARMLASRHADYWLVDFLEELRRKPKSLAGLPKYRIHRDK